MIQTAARPADLELSQVHRGSVIDTSLLIADLKLAYERSRRPVDVDFRKLVEWIRLGDQLTHQVHPYPAKLLPNIAHFFVRASCLHPRNRRVLDPFCGSGTVALEASLAGCVPHVADANPLALLVTRVKTTPYDTTELSQHLSRLLARVARFRHAPIVDIVNAHLWYTPARKLELERLLRAVNEIEHDEIRDFFRVAFSVTARRLSLADPAISVPVRLRTKRSFSTSTNRRIREHLAWIETASAVVEFERACRANIRRVAEANLLLPSRHAAVEVGTDARQLRLPGEPQTDLTSGGIPLTVTSPPYGSAQKYVRATSLSLNWLGFARPEDLSALEEQSIGREHVPAWRGSITERLPKVYETMLRRVERSNSRRAKITRTYLVELRQALKEVARVTAPGGRVVLVVGNNQVCGESLRNDQFIIEVLGEAGVALELHLLDDIRSRGLMTKRNRTASVISRESVMVFQKAK